MKKHTTPTAAVMSAYVKQTRTFGYTYVHAAIREACNQYDCIPASPILFRLSGYGRSLQGGGHKYKVHAINRETGRPVPTASLPRD
jgi:hypothetical protein